MYKHMHVHAHTCTSTYKHYIVEPLNKGYDRKTLIIKEVPNIHFPIHFNLRNNLPTKDKMAGPNMSSIWRFHCT